MNEADLIDAETGLFLATARKARLGHNGPTFGWILDRMQRCIFVWDHDDGMTVTNAAASVLSFVQKELLAIPLHPQDVRKLPLCYRDSEGRWDTITRDPETGAMAGFAPGPPKGITVCEEALSERIAPAVRLVP